MNFWPAFSQEFSKVAITYSSPAAESLSRQAKEALIKILAAKKTPRIARQVGASIRDAAARLKSKEAHKHRYFMHKVIGAGSGLLGGIAGFGLGRASKREGKKA